MNIICYGDSNTYGYDPRCFLSGRYEADSRWVDILAEKTGWHIQNEGMNGREIPRRAFSFPENPDLFLVMLGSNDLLQGNSVSEVTQRMEAFLTDLSLKREQILLIAPPPMGPGAWVPGEDLIAASRALGEAYRRLSERLGIRFADAGEWNIPVAHDGVHFTQAGHRAFATGLYKVLNSSIPFHSAGGW